MLYCNSSWNLDLSVINIILSCMIFFFSWRKQESESSSDSDSDSDSDLIGPPLPPQHTVQAKEDEEMRSQGHAGSDEEEEDDDEGEAQDDDDDDDDVCLTSYYAVVHSKISKVLQKHLCDVFKKSPLDGSIRAATMRLRLLTKVIEINRC